jgi:hypothetical protein
MAQRPWTSAEERLLRQLYPVKSQRECGALLGRSHEAIASRAKILKVRRVRKYHTWTETEDARLRKEYANTKTNVLSVIFGTDKGGVYARAKKLGLKKSEAYLAECLQECGRNISAHPRSIAGRIQKGNVPPNKGLRRPGWHAGRMRETQFRKGTKPPNYCPVGTVKLNGDGYLRIKVLPHSCGHGAKDKAWEFVHRRVWEAAHGPISKGHRIWWKDGNHENCAIENLELLSDREHMARTTVQRFPSDVKEVIRARAQLIRRINKINGKKQTERPKRSPVRDSRGVEGSR